MDAAASYHLGSGLLGGAADQAADDLTKNGKHAPAARKVRRFTFAFDGEA
jgi:hypothetical protein